MMTEEEIPGDLDELFASSPVAALQEERPRFMEIVLGPEDHGSICISPGNVYNNGAQLRLDPDLWLRQGLAGVRIIGRGPNPTHLICDSWDGITLWTTRHAGVVRLENVHLHAGSRCGAQFGEANYGRVLVPGFRLEMHGCLATVDPPRPGEGRTKWLLFGYQADLILRHVVLNALHASEHGCYWHGTAGLGIYWFDVLVEATGAEQLKLRSDATETAWAGSRVWVIVDQCSFQDWYQTWSDRGGAAIVVQGGAAHLRITNSLFRGGPAVGSIQSHQRSRCIMISSEAASYNMVTGEIGTGPGNGYLFIRRCGFVGGPGRSDYAGSEIIRVGRNSGAQRAARGVLIEESGIYGDREHVVLNDISGRVLVRDCNTPEIRELANALSMNTEHEAVWLGGGGIRPISAGVDFGGRVR